MEDHRNYRLECDRLLELGYKLKWGLYLFLTTNKQAIATTRMKHWNYESNLQEVVTNLFLIPKYVLSVKSLLTNIFTDNRPYAYSFTVVRLLALVHDLDIIKDAHTQDIVGILTKLAEIQDQGAQTFVPGVRPQDTTQRKISNFFRSYDQPGTKSTTEKRSSKQGLTKPDNPESSHTEGGGGGEEKHDIFDIPDVQKEQLIMSAPNDPSIKITKAIDTTNENASEEKNDDKTKGPPKMTVKGPSPMELHTILSWYKQKKSGIVAIHSIQTSQTKFWLITMKMLLKAGNNFTLSPEEKELVLRGIVYSIFMIMSDNTDDDANIQHYIKRSIDVASSYIRNKDKTLLCCGIHYDLTSLLKNAGPLRQNSTKTRRSIDLHGIFSSQSPSTQNTQNAHTVPTIQKFNIEDKADILSAIETLGIVGKVSDELLLRSMGQLNRALEGLYETITSMKRFLIYINNPENSNYLVTEAQKDDYIQCIAAVKELQREIPKMPDLKNTAATRLAGVINWYAKKSREVSAHLHTYGLSADGKPISSREEGLKLCVMLDMLLQKNNDPAGYSFIDLSLVHSLYTAMSFQEHIASVLDLSFICFVEGTFGLLKGRTGEVEYALKMSNSLIYTELTTGSYGNSLNAYYGPFPQLNINDSEFSHNSPQMALKSPPITVATPNPPSTLFSSVTRTDSTLSGATTGFPLSHPALPRSAFQFPQTTNTSLSMKSKLGQRQDEFFTQTDIQVTQQQQKSPQPHQSPLTSSPLTSGESTITNTNSTPETTNSFNTNETINNTINNTNTINNNSTSSDASRRVSAAGGTSAAAAAAASGSAKYATINFRFLLTLLRHGFREIHKEFSPNLHYLKNVYDDVREYRVYAAGVDEVVDAAKHAMDIKLADSLCVQLIGSALLSVDAVMSKLDTEMQLRLMSSPTQRAVLGEQDWSKNFLAAIKFMEHDALPEVGAQILNSKLSDKLKDLTHIPPDSEPGSFRAYSLFLFQVALNIAGELIDAGKLRVGFELPLQLSCMSHLTTAARYFIREMLHTQFYIDHVPWTNDAAEFLCNTIEDMITEAPALAVARDMLQSSLLHWAVATTLPRAYAARLVTFLVTHGTPIDGRDCFLRPPLLCCNSLANVYLLLKLGASITATNSDEVSILEMHPEWAADILRHEGYKAPGPSAAKGEGEDQGRDAVKSFELDFLDDDDVAISDDIYDGDADDSYGDTLAKGGHPNAVLKDLPPKEVSTIIDVALYSEPTGHNRQSDMSLAEQFIILAANASSNLPLLQGTVYPWLHKKIKAAQQQRIEEIAAADAAAFNTFGLRNSAPEAKSDSDENGKGKGEGGSAIRIPGYCWPLVRLDVTGDNNTTYARLHIVGMEAEGTTRDTQIYLSLYSIANPETLDEGHIREAMRSSGGISKFLIGVGADIRRDQTAIYNYWEHHSLPIRQEDAIEAGRALRLQGHGECDDTPEDMRSILESAVYYHIVRTNSEAQQDPQSRIRALVPMAMQDRTYEEVKMLVLGHEAAGKTSLIDSLSETSFLQLIWKKRKSQTVSTVGVNRVKFQMDDVPVNIYDFAGQLEYHVIHEYFLSSIGALYIVVVDGSQEDPIGQLNHWLQLLHSHSRGPRSACGLIVVCTKADIIAKLYGEDAIEARRGFLEDAVRHWPFLCKITAPAVFMVSNKTGTGIAQLKEHMRTRFREIINTPTSNLFLKAGAAVQSSAGGPFLTFGEFYNVLRDREIITQSMPDKHRKQIAKDALAYLSNIGKIVTSINYEMVCTNPSLMSNILSIFVCQQEHMKRIIPNINIRTRMDIITRTEFTRRLLSLNEVGGSSDPELLCDKIIKTLESMEFCFNLTSDEARRAYGLDTGSEQCYIFPALRDFVDIATLPPEEEEGDITQDNIIFEVDCHGWECTHCHAITSKPFKEGFCQFCGGYESVHVCLNEKRAGHEFHQEIGSKYLAAIGKRDFDWICYSMVGDKINNVSIPADIPCIHTMPKETRYTCCMVSSMLEQGINMGHFNRTIANLRRWLDPRYRIFKNFAVFKDIYGNTTMVTLFKRDTHSSQLMLGIITRGPLPHLFPESLHPLLELGEAVTAGCPACAQFSCFSPLAPAGNHLRCENGHVVTTEEARLGMLSNNSLKSNSVMWGPRKATSFYTESVGKWISAKDVDAVGLTNARLVDIREPGAYFTVLTEKEPTPARKQEYNFARSLFYNFVGKDPVNSPFRLTKVVFVDNKELETSFSGKFSSLIKKAYTTYGDIKSAKEGINTNYEQNQQQQKGQNDSRNPKKINLEEAVSAIIASVDSGGKEMKKQMRYIAASPEEKLVSWRQWIMHHLGKSLERACGNEQVNLVGGWHGTISLAARGISRTNFRAPEDGDTVSKDPGYFGKGVYFTQSPSYGAEYAVLSAKGAKERALRNNSALSEEDLSNCLVFSWLLLGRVYPVTEKADYGEGSLLGKPCKEGYDSHYVVLPNTEKEAKSANNLSYAIMKPFDPFSKETPGYDEIVVFSKSQILPRYIFYYETNLNVTKSKGGKVFLPLNLRDARTIGLWVDDSATSESMEALQEKLHTTCVQHENVSVVSSLELRTWLRKFGAEVSAKLRIFCTSFNPSDGGSNCTWRVINEVRKVAKLKKVPILIYKKPGSDNEKTEQIYFSRMNLVYYAKTFDDMKPFIDSGKL